MASQKGILPKVRIHDHARGTTFGSQKLPMWPVKLHKQKQLFVAGVQNLLKGLE